MVADVGAAVVRGLLCEKRTSRAYCKSRPTIEKPAALSYNSNALDRLVEVALSPTEPQHLSRLPVDTQLPTTTPGIASADGDFGVMDNNNLDHDAATKLSSFDIKSPDQQQQQMAPKYYNNNPHFAFHAMDAHKLKRLPSLPQTPQPRSSSSSTATRYHQHSRRFTPRFKSLLDICC